MMYRPSYSSKSEWQIPTLRERTSTSSAAIAGTSMSRTAACCGCSNTSAFISSHSSLVDQHLDLVGFARRELRKDIRRVIERDCPRDDSLDRQVAGGDLSHDSIEVVHPIAPGSHDRQVVQSPEHRLDNCLADEEPGLCKRAAPTERPNRVREPGRMARALDRDIHAEPVTLIAEIHGKIDRGRIEDRRDSERRRSLPSSSIRLRDVHGRRAGRARAERCKRTDRPGACDQDAVTRTN